MGKNLLTVGIITLVMFLSISVSQAQNGSLKYCPGTSSWEANKKMVEDKAFMFENYALGPDGCWYLKDAVHGSYKEGYYQWDVKNKIRYFYDKKKKVWESADRKTCLAGSPFGK